MIELKRTDRTLGLAALMLLLAGCLLVLLPFVTALLWAVILTYSTWPVYANLKASVHGRKTLAAALMTVAVAIVLLAPFLIVVASLADNAAELVDALRRLFERGLPDAPAWVRDLPIVGSRVDAYWRGLVHDETRMIDEMRAILVSARAILVASGGYLTAGVLQLALSVLVAFFLFRDGEIAALRLQRIAMHLAGPRARYLLDVASHTVQSVVHGIIGTALAQGVLAGIGFLIAGVPGAALLGLATFLLSVLPIGPPLIWGSVAAWLYYQGSIGWAIFVALWGLLVVSMVDNFLKPIIISRGTQLPFILVFLGVLGGIIAFGLIGVFLGPTLLAVGYRILDEWTEQAQVE